MFGGCLQGGRPGRLPPGTGTRVSGLGVERLWLSLGPVDRCVKGPAEGWRVAMLSVDQLWPRAGDEWGSFAVTYWAVSTLRVSVCSEARVLRHRKEKSKKMLPNIGANDYLDLLNFCSYSLCTKF